MKFCSQCGSKVSLRIPEGDTRERHVCDSCGFIHYFNPRIIAGTVPTVGSKVLLCRRAIEPRKGYWTLPAGFMENGETTQEAALRETWEEAEAKLNLDGLYSLFNLPHINQVYIFFRGEVIDGEFGVGEESLETQLFEEHEIPWDSLAFPTIYKTLKHFYADREAGEFQVRIEDIDAFRHKRSNTVDPD
ncbi:MAG: NUDIX hydrolase [Pseudomonadales bacterium]|nr:NUDIX hydrolase [Pseudomonadales bacterium]